MIRYQWKVTIQRERTVIYNRYFPTEQGKVVQETIERRHPRLYKTPQDAEQAKQDHFAGKSRYSRLDYPPEATWELTEIESCPTKSYDPLCLTSLRSRMDALRKSRSSQS
jgi:hypothetical protein